MSMHDLTIRFLSDWTIGTGKATNGFVDQAVKRDHRGLPVVEGGYLLRLWRDAAESVAAAFGTSGGAASWADAVDRLFGAGGAFGDGLLRTRGDAQLVWADYLRSDAPNAELYRRQLVVHRNSTQIDERRHVALNETLRVREAVRVGTVLSVGVEMPDWNDGLPWPIELLLAASLRRLDHLSGKRRRGAGRCEVTCSTLDYLTALEAHGPKLLDGKAEAELTAITWPTRRAGVIPRAPGASGTSSSDADPNDGTWGLRYRYRVELDQPVVASKRVVGNTIESHDFLPGAFVLPIVAHAIGQPVGVAIGDAHLVVTPAHPDLGGMSARVPQVWVSGNKGKAWRDDGLGLDGWGESVPDGCKPISGWERGGAVGGVKLDLSGHAVIDDVTQRPGLNGLYALQAISGGQSFAGEIWDDGTLGDALKGVEKLNGTTQRFGRGRKLRGTGRFRVESVEDTRTDASTIPAGTPLRLRLLTDAVLLDEFGLPQPSASSFVEEVGRLVGVNAKLLRSRVSISRTESWNTTHGLPRASVVALAAGSVVELTFAGDVPQATLNNVLASGLGELRVEGFGRAALLPPDVPALASAKPVRAVQTKGREPQGDADWAGLRTAMWADELQQRALASPGVVKAKWFPGGLPSGDERGLRTAAREALRTGGPNPLDRWCGRTNTEQFKRDLRQNAKDGTKPLADSARSLLGTDAPDDLGGLDPVTVVATFVIAYTQAAHRERKVGGRHGA